MKPELQRLHYIDVLNCIAIIFVLLLHSSQLAHFGISKDSNFIVTEIMQCLFIPAVYIFFMNSGATLLDYRDKYDTKTFYKKRLKRVLIPFLFWSAFYYLFNSRFHSFPGPIFQEDIGIKNFLEQFLNNYSINNTMSELDSANLQGIVLQADNAELLKYLISNNKNATNLIATELIKELAEIKKDESETWWSK